MQRWLISYLSLWIVIYIIYIALLFNEYDQPTNVKEEKRKYYTYPMFILIFIAYILAIVLGEKLKLGYRGAEVVLFVTVFVAGIVMFVTDWAFSKLKDKPLQIFSRVL